MKNMMKKMTALALIVMILMSFASVSALAENESVVVYAANEEVFYGDKVTLIAEVAGVDGDYTIVWEAGEDGNWQKVGTGRTYSFIADESNTACAYRAVVIIAD